MADSPNYGFHRKPRFSANQVADYIATDTAAQRRAVIRQAKFPRKVQVVPYAPARRLICGFLAANNNNIPALDANIVRLERRHAREPEGWMKGEYHRNIAALKAFKESLTTTKPQRFVFVAGPANVVMVLAGVRINIRLDPTVTGTNEDGAARAGGCVTFLASTSAARRKIEDRRKTVAALVHWGLEGTAGGNIPPPLHRLCLSYDVFGGVITSAPKAIDRLRGNIRSSCEEAAELWDGVKPPPDYDGPDWR